MSFAAISRLQHRQSLCQAGGEKQNEPMTEQIQNDKTPFLLSVSFAAISRVQHRQSLCHAGGEKQNEPMTEQIMTDYMDKHLNCQ